MWWCWEGFRDFHIRLLFPASLFALFYPFRSIKTLYLPLLIFHSSSIDYEKHEVTPDLEASNSSDQSAASFGPLLLPHICMCNFCVCYCHRGGYLVCSDWIRYKLADLFSLGYVANGWFISGVLQTFMQRLLFFNTIAACITSLLLIFLKIHAKCMPHVKC